MTKSFVVIMYWGKPGIDWPLVRWTAIKCQPREMRQTIEANAFKNRIVDGVPSNPRVLFGLEKRTIHFMMFGHTYVADAV